MLSELFVQFRQMLFILFIPSNAFIFFQQLKSSHDVIVYGALAHCWMNLKINNKITAHS